MNLLISEITGFRFQGEGPNTGKPITILRLGGCNLRCVWCDTAYTWDWARFDRADEVISLTVEQVAGRLVQAGRSGIRHVMITGGEPMLQQLALIELAKQLGDGWFYEVETAGTIAPLPDWKPDHYNVSLKLKHSGNADHLRLVPVPIVALQATGRAAWKFVARYEDDFDEIDQIVNTYDLHPVYVMPEGIDAATILMRSPAIAEAAIARGYSFSTRLHVLLYGNQRGY